ncbi:MAG TPA: YciI family protein [Methanomicrobiales archaeon]|nr:YciI family protein [Methanomicrobiales archaeon]
MVMSAAMYFISTLRPRRPDFLATMTPDEKAVMGEHASYTKRLFDEGKIILGGAATDGAIGVIVWRLGSAEEARRIYENDPAVKAGIGEAELHPFRVGLLAGKV